MFKSRTRSRILETRVDCPYDHFGRILHTRKGPCWPRLIRRRTLAARISGKRRTLRLTPGYLRGAAGRNEPMVPLIRLWGQS